MNTNNPRLLWLMVLALIATAMPARAQDGPAPIGPVNLNLPPPPPPADLSPPPAVDPIQLALGCDTRSRAVASLVPPAAAPPRQLASAEPTVGRILQDVGRMAGGRHVLESMLFEQLRQALPGSKDYLLEQATIPDHISPPARGWTVRYDFRLPMSGIGRATYTASLRDNKTGNVQRFSGTVSIDREATGVTVTRLVHRGAPIRPQDLQVLPARLSQLPRGALADKDSAVGAKTRKELRPGEWITDQMIVIPDVVKRGQAVTIRLLHGPLTIVTPGVVQQTGGRGDSVRVKNAQSNKEIVARVISKDEVQVIEQ